MAKHRPADGPSTPATVGARPRRRALHPPPLRRTTRPRPSYGLEAAEALGVAPARVFKTLLVDTGKGLAVGIVPVDGQLDLKAVASALGVKA